MFIIEYYQYFRNSFLPIPMHYNQRVITIPTSYSVNLFVHFLTFNINKIIWYLLFREVYIVLETFMLLSVSIVVYYHCYSIKNCVTMTQLFIHWTESYLCSFQFEITINSSLISIFLSFHDRKYVQISLKCIAKEENFESYYRHILLIRNCQACTCPKRC